MALPTWDFLGEGREPHLPEVLVEGDRKMGPETDPAFYLALNAHLEGQWKFYPDCSLIMLGTRLQELGTLNTPASLSYR